jgi:hypothetical protein
MCAEARRAPLAFVLTTGDNFYNPDGRATAGNFWRPERCLRALRVPWRAAWGNHDLGGTSTADVLGARRHWYSFAAGPARIVVLDANRPADPDQLAFLKRTLRAATEPARIVAFHQPAYTAGLHAPGADQQRLWAPVFRRARVALVLQGHNHLYERLEVDGVTYITTGGGGGELYPCVRPAAGLRRCLPARHFLLVNVNASRIAVRAVTPTGATLERVAIPVPPAG